MWFASYAQSMQGSPQSCDFEFDFRSASFAQQRDSHDHQQRSHAVTWNDFGNLELVNITDAGIIVSQFADTNTFNSIRMHLRGTARDGMVFNDAAVLGDVDASGNIVRALDCDGEPGFAGACAHFKGYTVGNYVMLGFSTVPEQNKVVFDNTFSAGANSILKLQKNPKQP